MPNSVLSTHNCFATPIVVRWTCETILEGNRKIWRNSKAVDIEWGGEGERKQEGGVNLIK